MQYAAYYNYVHGWFMHIHMYIHRSTHYQCVHTHQWLLKMHYSTLSVLINLHAVLDLRKASEKCEKTSNYSGRSGAHILQTIMKFSYTAAHILHYIGLALTPYSAMSTLTELRCEISLVRKRVHLLSKLSEHYVIHFLRFHAP